MTQVTRYPLQPVAGERSQGLAKEGAPDKEAFRCLYQAYAPQLFRYFWIHTRSRAQAEDLVSETFLGALRHSLAYSASRAPVSAWLFGIAKRALARHRRTLSTERLADAQIQDVMARVPDAASPAPGEYIDLWQAVSELSAPERDVIALKFGAGLTHHEIAEVTGLRPANVGAAIYRTLQKLRGRLNGEEGDHA